MRVIDYTKFLLTIWGDKREIRDERLPLRIACLLASAGRIVLSLLGFQATRAKRTRSKVLGKTIYTTPTSNYSDHSRLP